MSMNTSEFNLTVPDDIADSVRHLKETVYSRKTVEEIYQLLLWRGLERTARLIAHKEQKTTNNQEKREMLKKETCTDQCCRVELDNGISLNINKQNPTAWSVTAKLELLLDEYKNILSRDEAEFIAGRLSQKYSHVNVEELLQLKD